MAVKVPNKYFNRTIQSPRTKLTSSHETHQPLRTNPAIPHETRQLFRTKPTTRKKLTNCFAQNQPPRTKPVVPLHETRQSHCMSCLITHAGEFITKQVGYIGLRVAEQSRILRGDGSTQLVVAAIYFTNPSSYAIHDRRVRNEMSVRDDQQISCGGTMGFVRGGCSCAKQLVSFVRGGWFCAKQLASFVWDGWIRAKRLVSFMRRGQFRARRLDRAIEIFIRHFDRHRSRRRGPNCTAHGPSLCPRATKKVANISR